nr:class I SAM-dependent methyltransferase [Halocatena pleomorpha]
MWDRSREALAPLSLDDRELILDVGCGTGELSAVLSEETDGTVIGVDRDRKLLEETTVPAVRADATALPFEPRTADLVVCQALLINLPDPSRAVAEFVRCSTDLVAAIEPDNSAVTVESTVSLERELATQARSHYIQGVQTDVTLGTVPELLRSHGQPGREVTDVHTQRYDHVKTIEPPYDQHAIEAAKRKATGSQIAQQRETLLAGGMSPDEYDAFRASWREMGRLIIDAMQNGTYRRQETIPFYVTVGKIT